MNDPEDDYEPSLCAGAGKGYTPCAPDVRTTDTERVDIDTMRTDFEQARVLNRRLALHQYLAMDVVAIDDEFFDALFANRHRDITEIIDRRKVAREALEAAATERDIG